jgi:hypothetical protein
LSWHQRPLLLLLCVPGSVGSSSRQQVQQLLTCQRPSAAAVAAAAVAVAVAGAAAD